MSPSLPRPRWRFAPLGIALCAGAPSLADAAPTELEPQVITANPLGDSSPRRPAACCRATN